MSMRLSVVVPLYNEAEALPELTTRLEAAAEEAAVPFELVLVDDASTDESRRILAAWEQGSRRRVVALPSNRGQFAATREGLLQASGEWVAVLDGDLQDPPELLPALMRETERRPGIEVVFAVKSHRDDPAWMRAGQAAFHLFQAHLARAPFPPGAGSYCLMQGSLAKKIGALPLEEANLASVLAALQVKAAKVVYEKQARRHGHSRVGPLRLAKEALESLAVTGALESLARLWAFVLFPAALMASWAALAGLRFAWYALVVLCAATFLAGTAWWHGRRRRADLRWLSE